MQLKMLGTEHAHSMRRLKRAEISISFINCISTIGRDEREAFSHYRPYQSILSLSVLRTWQCRWPRCAIFIKIIDKAIAEGCNIDFIRLKRKPLIRYHYAARRFWRK